MVPVVAIQLVFLVLTVLQIPTSAVTHNGLILLLCPESQCPNSTAPCLVRGTPTTRRDDFTYTPGIGGHKLHSGLATWNSARRICREQGSYLTIINSVAEAEVIVRLLKGARIQHSWVGVHDLYHEDEFVTIHGEPLVETGYDKWQPGEPNNANNNEHCLLVSEKRELLDIPCNHRHSVICEIP